MSSKKNRPASYYNSLDISRKVCKATHLFICVNCFSDFDVQVHHYDINPSNTDKFNLVPMCQTCHTKLHQDDLDIITRVDNYVENFKNNNQKVYISNTKSRYCRQPTGIQVKTDSVILQHLINKNLVRFGIIRGEKKKIKRRLPYAKRGDKNTHITKKLKKYGFIILPRYTKNTSINGLQHVLISSYKFRIFNQTNLP